MTYNDFQRTKIAHSPVDIWPPSETWYLLPTRVHNPNGISVGSAFSAGLTTVTDRPTDHATQSVTTDRICIYVVQCMRPKK